jgi:hypothetical protein
MTYVAIDPTAVDELAASLDTAATSVEESLLAVSRSLSSGGVSATAPSRLRAVASSLRLRAAGLRSRLAELRRLQALYRHMGEPGPVYPKPSTVFPSFAAAAAAGDALGARLEALADGTAWWDADRVMPALDVLSAHAGDPTFCAAVFSHLSPLVAMLWYEQLGQLSKRPEFPMRDDLVRPFLTALSSGLTSSPSLLAAYLGPIKEMLLPGDQRDLLRYGAYSDDVVYDVARAAIDRHLQGMYGMNWWESDPGLLSVVASRPEVARRLVASLPEGTLRTLMSSGEGFLAGFGAVAVSADAVSPAAYERLVSVVGRHDDHLASEVQDGLATVLGNHLEDAGYSVASGAYPGGLGQDDMVSVFARVMHDNPDAFATLHDAAASLTPVLLHREHALSRFSTDVATLGGVYGLLARADASDAVASADAAAAGWWSMASKGLSLVPLPGPAVAGAVVKRVASTALDAHADDIRARGDSEAMDFLVHGYDQGRLTLAVALWQRDQASHPAAVSALAPPAALFRDDGTLKVFPEIDSVAEREALRAWLATPTSVRLTDVDGTAHLGTLDEVTREIDDEFVASFQKLGIRP